MYRHNHFSILLSELQEYHHLKKMVAKAMKKLITIIYPSADKTAYGNFSGLLLMWSWNSSYCTRLHKHIPPVSSIPLSI